MLLSACGASGGGGFFFDGGLPPGDRGVLAADSAMPPGGFSITVDGAAQVGAIGGNLPPAGRRFLDLAITLRNSSDPNPLSTASTLFSVTTRGAINVQASARTPLAMSPCSADLKVVAGGQISCHLVFEIPDGDAAATLLYKDERGRIASAPIGQVATVYDRRAGRYALTQQPSVQTMCSPVIAADPPPSLELLTRGKDIAFGEIQGANMSPAVFPMMGNEGSVVTPPRAGFSLTGCQWRHIDAITVRFTADGEFEYASESKVDNLNNMNCLGAMPCTITSNATYRRQL